MQKLWRQLWTSSWRSIITVGSPAAASGPFLLSLVDLSCSRWWTFLAAAGGPFPALASVPSCGRLDGIQSCVVHLLGAVITCPVRRDGDMTYLLFGCLALLFGCLGVP